MPTFAGVTFAIRVQDGLIPIEFEPSQLKTVTPIPGANANDVQLGGLTYATLALSAMIDNLADYSTLKTALVAATSGTLAYRGVNYANCVLTAIRQPMVNPETGRVQAELEFERSS
jgi:hypothetical protein